MHQVEPDKAKEKPKKAYYPWVILVVVLLNFLFSGIFLYFGYNYLYSSEIKRWEWDSGSFQYAKGSWHFPFIIHLNDLQLETEGLVWSEDTLEFHLNPLAFLSPDRHFLTVNAHSPIVRLFDNGQKDSTETVSDSLKTLEPIDLDLPTIPVPLKVMIHNSELYQNDKIIFKAKYLRLKQDQVNQYQFLGHGLSYDKYQVDRLTLGVDYHQSDSIFAKIDLTRSEGDTLELLASVPKKAAQSVNGQIKLVAQSDLLRSHKEFPKIKTFALKGVGSFDWVKNESQAELGWQGQVLNDQYLNHMFPIPAGELTGFAKLRGTQFNAQIGFSSDQGPTLDLNGGGNFKASKWDLQVLGYDMHIGQYSFPADIHRGRVNLTDKGLHVIGYTRDQSQFTYEMSWKEPAKFKAKVLLNPEETWANAWTKGKVKLEPGTFATSEFDGKLFKGVVGTSSKDAYGMKADSVKINYTLYPQYIAFENSQIAAEQVVWDLNGEVHWDKPSKQEFYRFEISNALGQRAAIWGNYTGDFSLQASSIPLQKVPFKEPLLPEGLSGTLTGRWTTHFGLHRKGSAFFDLELLYKDLPLDLVLNVEEKGDSTDINSFEILTGNSRLYGNALLMGGLSAPHLTKLNLSTQGTSLEFAEAFIHQPIRGKLMGDLHYNHEFDVGHFSSNLHVDSLEIGAIDEPLIEFQRFNIQSIDDTINIDTRLKLGRYQEWDSEVGVQLSNIFEDNFNWEIAVAADAGGIFWSQGTSAIDGNLKGKFSLNGSWFTPINGLQVDSSKVNGQLQMQQFNDLATLNAQIAPSEIRLKTGESLTNDIFFEADFSKHLLAFQAKVLADSNTHLNVDAEINTKTGLIPKLNANSDDIYLDLGAGGKVRLKGLNVSHARKENSIEIPFRANIIEYQNTLEGLGNIRSVLKYPYGKYIQPLQNGPTRAKIQANTGVQKFLFLNQNYPSIGLNGLTDWAGGVALDSWNSLRGNNSNRVIASNGSSRSGRSKGIDLDVTLRDLGEDSIMAITNLYTVPLTLDIKVTGNTNEPLITGDVTSTDDGWLEVMEDVRFDLTNIRLDWDTQPIPRGQLTVMSSKELPFCKTSENDLEEKCPVEMNAQGELGNFRLVPEANCGTQGALRPDQIFTGIFVGCISEDGNSAEWGQLVDAAIYRGGSAIVKTGINQVIKWLGTDRDMIKDLNFKLKNEDYEADSSNIYISSNIPGLSSNNININFERVWDTSSEVDYEDYTKVSMSLNLYNSVQGNGLLADWVKTKSEYPQIWSTEIGLTSKNYFSQTAEGGTENELEGNVGLSFERPFWDWCFLGLGDCEDD